MTDAEAGVAAQHALGRLGWDPPGSSDALADRWIDELDRRGVSRAMIIASVAGDSASVAAAIRRHPRRLVGAFMVDPTLPGAREHAAQAIEQDGLRMICLFPAMHRCAIHDERTKALFRVAEHAHAAVFVHCGVLSVGARKRLGLSSRFDVTLGNPLDLHAIALAHPHVPIVIPHFGAGLFREALMVADLCPNIFFDTSSSNGWMKYHPGLTLAAVFKQALDVVGPERLLFGTDSSFFPRGWVSDVHVRQADVLNDLGVGTEARAQVFGGNFETLFKP